MKLTIDVTVNDGFWHIWFNRRGFHIWWDTWFFRIDTERLTESEWKEILIASGLG